MASSKVALTIVPFFTDELERNWGRAVEMGFFAGELISAQVYNRWMTVCNWTPARLSDGEIGLLSEFRLVDENELSVPMLDAFP